MQLPIAGLSPVDSRDRLRLPFAHLLCQQEGDTLPFLKLGSLGEALANARALFRSPDVAMTT
jgi:hypothetical protein